jgi:two-component system chemotaxis response regulator CheY
MVSFFSRKGSRKKKSVLIVDDSRAVRMEIRRVMEGLGFDVQGAENGQVALAVLKEGDVSLALIDWNMPVMNGLQLIHRLEKDGRLKSMKVLMVTTRGELDDMIKALEQGGQRLPGQTLFPGGPGGQAGLPRFVAPHGAESPPSVAALENLPQPHRLGAHEGIALGGDLAHGAGAGLACVRVGGAVEDRPLV